MTIDSFRGKYEFLSNFYESPFYAHHPISRIKLEWKSGEALFQALKTFNENEVREIELAKTPGQAKRLGRKAKLRPDWEDIKVDMMRYTIQSKFPPNSKLAKSLLETGDEELIEGNRHGDTIWGTVNGVGKNYLGIVLMEHRSKLREKVGVQESLDV